MEKNPLLKTNLKKTARVTTKSSEASREARGSRGGWVTAGTPRPRRLLGPYCSNEMARLVDPTHDSQVDLTRPLWRFYIGIESVYKQTKITKGIFIFHYIFSNLVPYSSQTV